MSGTRCRFVVISAMLPLGGCDGMQSILDPHSLNASRIAQLSWVLFAGGAFALCVVVASIGVALRGSATARARLSSTTVVIAGGVVFPALTLTCLLGYGVWLTQASVPPASDEAAALRIEVVGEQWWWRVAYSGPDGQPVASANEIRMPAGRPITFILKSADVIHSFWVPNLAGKVDMIPGRTTKLRLVADRPGVFRGQCAEYCGGPHALMALEVVALADADFNAWIAMQAGAATPPATPTTERGQSLFLAAGCGGCHAIRGTEARGSVGPDLTHIGSRRSVGRDTTPVTPTNLARFIVDGQHIKPGNRMPPFGIFGKEDLNALAAYLASLQ